ncbi:hypothetical protein MMC25_001725 [Agyrium rufum]|nr:hypothetical protein [Agyrium rufum]
MEVPKAFLDSYLEFESYPCNLVNSTTYSGALQCYKNRLDSIASRLCTKEEANDVYEDTKVHVAFRDFEFEPTKGQGKHQSSLRRTHLLTSLEVTHKRNVTSDSTLKIWLGDESAVDPLAASRTGEAVTKKDLKCRFIFLHGGHSRKPLKITRSMLVRILTYHQVMACYLDFLSVFGMSGDPRELGFSAFREQIFLRDSPRALQAFSLGRSGRQYQMSYNLKGVACISGKETPEDLRQWSIRQAAMHHQFDVVCGTTLWIIAKGDLELKARIQTLTGDAGRPEDKAFESPEASFRSSLAAHLVYCQWALEEWRWYIQWLEDQIEKGMTIAVKPELAIIFYRKTFSKSTSMRTGPGKHA